MQLSANFSLAELTVTNSGLPNIPSVSQIANLQDLATHILQPLRLALAKPIVVTSGFRCPQVNKAVGGVADSQHVSGQAADIHVEGMTPIELAQYIHQLGLPYDQLIREPTWVHVSYGPQNRRQCLTMRGGHYFAGLT